MSSCEIHVPISPTAAFVQQVRLLATSVRRYGGELADAAVVVTVGGEKRFDLDRAYPWSRPLGIEWRWVDQTLWRRYGTSATALQRFRYEIDAPTALMLDADTLLVAPIDDLLADIHTDEAVYGRPAGHSPFRPDSREDEEREWQRLFDAAGVARPPMSMEHSAPQTLEFDPTRRFAPPYFNLGFVCAPSRLLRRLRDTLVTDMETTWLVRPTPFVCQVALCLSLVRSGVPWRTLPLRFNFPNDMAYLRRAEAEFDDLRVLHYSREEHFLRARDFDSPGALHSLLSRDPGHRLNARLWDTLRRIGADRESGTASLA